METESIDFASEPGSEGTGLHWSKSSTSSHQSPPAATDDATLLAALQARLLQDKSVQKNPALRNNVRLISQVLQKRRAEESRSLNGSRHSSEVVENESNAYLEEDANGENDEKDMDDDEDAPPVPARVVPAPTVSRHSAASASPPWHVPTNLASPLAPPTAPARAPSDTVFQSGRSSTISVDRFLRAVSQVDSFAFEAEDRELLRPSSVHSSDEEGDGDLSSIAFLEESGATSRSHSQSGRRRGPRDSHLSHSDVKTDAEDDTDHDDDDDEAASAEDEAALHAVLSSNTRRPQSSQRSQTVPTSGINGALASGAAATASHTVPAAATRLYLQQPKNPAGTRMPRRDREGSEEDEDDDEEDEENAPRPFPPLPLTPSPSGVVAPKAGSPLRAGHAGMPSQSPSLSIMNPSSFASQHGHGEPESPTETTTHLLGSGSGGGVKGSPNRSPWNRVADRYQRELLTPDKGLLRGGDADDDDDDDDVDVGGGDGEEELRHLVGKRRSDVVAPVKPAPRTVPTEARPRVTSLSVSAIAAIKAEQEKREQEERAREALADAAAAAQQQAAEAGHARSNSALGRFVDAISPRKRHSSRRHHHADGEHKDDKDGKDGNDDDNEEPKEGAFRRFSRRLSAIFGGGRKKSKKDKKTNKKGDVNHGNTNHKAGPVKGPTESSTVPPVAVSAAASGIKPKKPAVAAPVADYRFPPPDDDTSHHHHKTSHGSSDDDDDDDDSAYSESGSGSIEVPFPKGIAHGGTRGTGRVGREGRGGRGVLPTGVPPMRDKSRRPGAEVAGRGGANPARTARAESGQGWSVSARSGRGDNASVLSDLVPHEMPQNVLFAAANSSTTSGFFAPAEVLGVAGRQGTTPPQAPPPPPPPHPPALSEVRHVPADVQKAVVKTVATPDTAGKADDTHHKDENEDDANAGTDDSVDFEVAESAVFPSIDQMRQSAHELTGLASTRDGDVSVHSASPRAPSQGPAAPNKKSKKVAQTETHTKQKRKMPPTHTTPEATPRGVAALLAASTPSKKDALPGRYVAWYDPESLLEQKRHQAAKAADKKAYAERRRAVNAHYSQHSWVPAPEKEAEAATSTTRTAFEAESPALPTVITVHSEDEGHEEGVEMEGKMPHGHTSSYAHRRLSWHAGHAAGRGRQRRDRRRRAAAPASSSPSTAAATTMTGAAAVRPLRRLSPRQFDKNVRQLARKEARLQRRLAQLDEVLERTRRHALVRVALDTDSALGGGTPSSVMAATALTSPARTPRTQAGASPSSTHRTDETVSRARPTHTASPSRVATRLWSTPRRGPRAVSAPPARGTSASPIVMSTTTKTTAARSATRPRRPPPSRPALQRYYDDLVHLTLVKEAPAQPHTTTARMSRGDAEADPEPEAFAPRPFLHTVPADMARLREALYHEYYYTTERTPAHMAGSVEEGTSSPPSQARTAPPAARTKKSPLRPSCAACGPQSAPAYAALALSSLVEQLSAAVHEDDDTDNTSHNKSQAHGAGYAPSMRQVPRDNLYSPYRGRPERKPARKSEASTAVSATGSLPCPVYAIPFTPSAHAVLAYGLYHELLAQESRVRAQIEAEELSTCLGLCEDLVQLLLRPADVEPTVAPVVERVNVGVGENAHAEDVGTHTVVVPIPPHVRAESRARSAESTPRLHANVPADAPPPATLASAPEAALTSDDDDDNNTNKDESESSAATTPLASVSTPPEPLSTTAHPAGAAAATADHNKDEDDPEEEAEMGHQSADTDTETIVQEVPSSQSTPTSAASSALPGAVASTATATSSPAHSVKSATDSQSANDVESDVEPMQAVQPSPAEKAAEPAPIRGMESDEEREAGPHDLQMAESSSQSTEEVVSAVAASTVEDDDHNEHHDDDATTTSPVPERSTSLPTSALESHAVEDQPFMTPPTNPVEVVGHEEPGHTSEQSGQSDRGDVEEEGVAAAETPPRRRSVHWPEEVVTETHEADLFMTNTPTTTSSGGSRRSSGSNSPSPSTHVPVSAARDASHESMAEADGYHAEGVPGELVAAARPDNDGVHDSAEFPSGPHLPASTGSSSSSSVSSSASVDAAAEQEDVDDAQVAKERENPFPTPRQDEDAEGSDVPPAQTQTPTQMATQIVQEAAPTLMPPRLSLGALTTEVAQTQIAVHEPSDHEPSDRIALVTPDNTSVAAEDAALELLDKLNGLDALLLSEFPHYFTKGEDTEGRPTAVLRGESGEAGVSPPRALSDSRARVSTLPGGTAAMMMPTSATWTNSFEPTVSDRLSARRPSYQLSSALAPDNQRIPLTTRTLLPSTGSGLFPTRRGSYASRGLPRDQVPRWSIQRSPEEASYEP